MHPKADCSLPSSYLINEKTLENLVPNIVRTLHRSRLSWLYIFLIVTFIALIFASQAVLSSLHESEQPITWNEAAIWQLEWWYLWLLLSPLRPAYRQTL